MSALERGLIGQAAVLLRGVRLWRRFYIRLTALYGVAVFLTLTAMSTALYFIGLRAEIDGLRDRLRAQSTAVALTLDADAIDAAQRDEARVAETRALVTRDLERLLRSDPEISSMYVLLATDEPAIFTFFADQSRPPVQSGTPGDRYDASGVPVMIQGLGGPAVETEPVADEYGFTLSGYAPLALTDGEVIGVVGVDVDASKVQALKREMLRWTGALYLGALLLLVGAAALVSRSVNGPLQRMLAATAAIARGRLGVRLNSQRVDEFGLLSHHLDLMAAGLEEREFIRATFGRYVSEDVARAVLARPEALQLGGEEREVTILFSDLRGYSTISEHLGPSQVVELVNAYLGAMQVVIDEQHGCVIEFLGDGILAVFGAPAPQADHPERAVRCALAMQARLAQLNEEWRQSGFADRWRDSGVEGLHVRIGIHTGRVVAGNLGSATRLKYAVIGDAVNVAARLEALNKQLDTQILMSDIVYCELPDDLARMAVDRGEHQVKGRAHSVRTWSISAREPGAA